MGQTTAPKTLPVAPGAATLDPASAPSPKDDAARRALAWIERGQPDSEIVFDEQAPKQTPEELAQFKSASLRRKR